MIARLRGVVEAMEEDRCVIDVGGVGYLVQASTRTLSGLPAAPEMARLLIETQVREDAITLYGFLDAAERDWFRLLLTVQGVGARVALNILSAAGPAELARAIAAGERGMLTRASGVGAKLAGRVLSELREKAGAMPVGGGGITLAPALAPGGEADTLSALANLGYRRAEAAPAVARAMARLGEEATVGQLIRESLQELAAR